MGHEMEAVNALTNKLKETTNSIQMTKRIQNKMELDTKRAKDTIVADFDALIRALALRKKQILASVDGKHKIVMNRLREQRENISESAKVLLTAKQGITRQMKGKEQSAERRENVIDLVSGCLDECDKYIPNGYAFVEKAEMKYDAGELERMKAYGKLTFNEEQLV